MHRVKNKTIQRESIYMVKVNYEKSCKRYKIRSKLTIKALERRHLQNIENLRTLSTKTLGIKQNIRASHSANFISPRLIHLFKVKR